MNQEKVGASVQGELFKRRRNEIPDAERVSTLQEKLYQKAKQEQGKSQRKCRLYGHKAFEVLSTKFGLIDPTKHALQKVRL